MPLKHSPQDVASIVDSQEQALQRAITKWIRFQQNVWAHIVWTLGKPIRRFAAVGIWFRVVIIILSATITTISDISEVSRTVITVLAGVLTALTGIEAYFKFSERVSMMQQQQREVQAKRDDLRYQWMVEVELEPDFEKRVKAAKKLLVAGPKAYNEILNKYAFESKESKDAPQVTGPEPEPI